MSKYTTKKKTTEGFLFLIGGWRPIVRYSRRKEEINISCEIVHIPTFRNTSVYTPVYL